MSETTLDQVRLGAHGPLVGTQGFRAMALTDDELTRLDPLAGAVSGDRQADMTFASAGRE